MFKNKFKRVLSTILYTTLVLGITSNSSAIMKVQATTSGTSIFAKGADVGWLSQMEATNYIFKDKDGNVKDCLSILKDYGIDSIRLRAWVNPSDSKTNGHCSTDEVVAMAVKAKAMGFRIMIDFHYSDSWADPGKQVKPVAWKDHDFSTLKTDVYDYTLGVMNALKTAGVSPEWVQVGNETNPGMLLPDGSIVDYNKLAELINMGHDAVKAISINTKVIVHIADGYNNVNFRKYFDGLNTNNAKYDVIGMSYYPYWAGTDYTSNIDALGNNLNDMAARYDKEVMVVEVGGLDTEPINTYNMLVAVQAKVKAVPNNRGTGVFYWEPEGAKSWSGYALSAWGLDGKPTKAMEAFLPGAIEYNPYPVTQVTLDKTSTAVEVGDTVAIKPTITPINATIVGVKYTSSDSTIAKIDSANGIITGVKSGTTTITVTTLDGNKTATCEVIITKNTKLVNNYGFELGLNDWTVTGDAAAVDLENDSHSGNIALHYNETAKNFTVSKTITGLANGSYKLSAWVSGGGGETTSQIYAQTSYKTTLTSDFTNSGWHVWTKPTVNNIQVTDGTLTIGAKYAAPGGQWGNIDEFELTRNNDISLSDLKIDGVIIKDFDPDITSYNVELSAGTTKVPTVTASAIGGTTLVTETSELPGETTVVVTVGNKTKTYTINFKVLNNPIKNSGFEPDATNWTISDYSAVNDSNDKHSGLKALGYYKSLAFTLTASQSLTGLSNGTYSLSAWAQGQSASSNVNQIFATNSKAVKLTSDFTNTGWGVWSKTTINNIIVTDGTLTLGLYLDAKAGDWGSYDDFELTQTSVAPSPSSNLSDLKVDGITINEFNPETTDYNVELPTGTTAVPTVVATVTDAGNANVIVTPASGLPGTTTVLVTAADGISTKTYTINFIKGKNTDVTLNDLKVNVETVTGVNANTTTSNLALPAETTDVPSVTATTDTDTSEEVVVVKPTTSTREVKLPKTGSTMDMDMIILIGLLLIGTGLVLVFKRKTVQK